MKFYFVFHVFFLWEMLTRGPQVHLLRVQMLKKIYWNLYNSYFEIVKSVIFYLKIVFYFLFGFINIQGHFYLFIGFGMPSLNTCPLVTQC